MHWASLARHKRAYRAACNITARSQGARPIDAQLLEVKIRFVPPDRRARDWDNMLASIKSGLDGLADVLGVDDGRWRISVEVAHGEIGGMVVVHVDHAPRLACAGQ